MTAYATRYPSAHQDSFARDHLPPVEEWPHITLTGAPATYPLAMNVARVLLDEPIAAGHGARIVLRQGENAWSYEDLRSAASRLAHVLVRELRLVPGNRVLLMGPNSLMLAAAWFAVLRAGGVAVTVMPLLRAKELAQIARKGEVDLVICDVRHLAEVRTAAAETGRLGTVITYGDGSLEAAMALHDAPFEPVDTAADDVALLAFTSGTTGNPKATMHFHRDVLTMADVVGTHLLSTSSADVYVGSPPLGFTFGLGALLVFPLRFQACAVFVEQPGVDALLGAVEKYDATCLFTAPTMYRHMLPAVARYRLSTLTRCVSAGEPLSKSTSDAWFAATGIRLTDGIGATEMIHMFIGARGEEARPGATGKCLPGYDAGVLDANGEFRRHGQGRLAVRGPTGCRYLADPRQRDYVVDGWNVTGDEFRIDEDGYFWFIARADDMILSAGYNIAGPEVEGALLGHSAVRECAVVGVPDEQRGQAVKAFIVLQPGVEGTAELAEQLQTFVKQSIAPYKYPRHIAFVDSLPKTPTGKIQRHALRQQAAAAS